MITSLGFNAEQWIKSEEDVRNEQLEMSQAQANIEGQQQIQGAIAHGVGAAAQQDIQETGGQGIQQALQQAQGGV